MGTGRILKMRTVFAVQFLCLLAVNFVSSVTYGRMTHSYQPDKAGLLITGLATLLSYMLILAEVAFATYRLGTSERYGKLLLRSRAQGRHFAPTKFMLTFIVVLSSFLFIWRFSIEHLSH
jgi:hypothetical protein